MSKKNWIYASHPSYAEILETSALVTLALLLFFLCFQPNKVAALESARWFWVIGGLLLTSFASMNVSQLLLQRLLFRSFSQEHKRLSRLGWGTPLIDGIEARSAYFVRSACSLTLLGVAIFLYFYFLEFIGLNFIAFMKIQVRTLLIGVFPMMALPSFHHKQFQTEKAVLTKDWSPLLLRQQSYGSSGRNEVISLSSESGHHALTVRLDNLLFIASADNYVFIFTKNRSGVNKELLRTSLSKVEERLRNYPNMFRCHRTAIVNLTNIKSVTGNSQGYRLRFEDVERTVPVARSRMRYFRQRREISGRRVFANTPK